jgi:hypothetical protein
VLFLRQFLASLVTNNVKILGCNIRTEITFQLNNQISPNSNAASGVFIRFGFVARFVVLAVLRIDIFPPAREVQAQAFEVVGFVTRTPKFH